MLDNQEIGEEEKRVGEEAKRAMAQGWVDKEDFKGDPTTWKTAEEFNKTGEEISAIQYERNKKLTAKLAELENRQVARDKEFKALTKYMKNSEKRQYAKAREDVLKEQRLAAKEGDMDRYDELEQDRKDLEKELEEKSEETISETDPGEHLNPVFAEWKKGNTWYYGGGADAYELTVEAEQYANYRLKSGAVPDMDFYNEVTEHVKKKYPNYFGNPNRDKPGAVVSGMPPTPKSARIKKKDFNSLPEEAKSVYFKDVKKQLGVSEAEYASAYWEEEV